MYESSVNVLEQSLGALAKLRKAIARCAMSVLFVCPRGTTRLPLDGFSLNLVFDDFSKTCLENSVSFKSNKYNGYFT